ncbi:MAG: GNAT family N-acetyltransferase, partial [Thermomicrobiales bacterium]|nr:GNAT family N-acetyltransferase [Thermomicrobiales bacterium]
MTEPAPLETGWQPTTPPDDTLLRAYTLNVAAASAVLADSLGGRTLVSDAYALADVGRDAGFASSGVLLQPLGADFARVMAEIGAFYADGWGETMLMSPWPTPDLRPLGWGLVGHPPLHLLPPGRSAAPLPPGVRVGAVGDAAALTEWQRIAVLAYPFATLRRFGPHPLAGPAVLDDARMRFWLAFADERPVGAAQTFTEAGVTQVMLVATLPAARRRGIGAALTWAAALADPALPALLLSSDEGRPVYARMGFLPLL